MKNISALNDYTIFHIRLVRYLWYVKKAPLGELAEALGVEYDALAKRLHRGSAKALTKNISMRTGTKGKQTGYKLSAHGKRLYNQAKVLNIRIPG